jgi:hypothetical protein
MSDHFVTEAATYITHTHEMTIHALSGIQTHYFSNQVAADLQIRPHSYWYQLAV